MKRSYFLSKSVVFLFLLVAGLIAADLKPEEFRLSQEEAKELFGEEHNLQPSPTKSTQGDAFITRDESELIVPVVPHGAACEDYDFLELIKLCNSLFSHKIHQPGLYKLSLTVDSKRYSNMTNLLQTAKHQDLYSVVELANHFIDSLQITQYEPHRSSITDDPRYINSESISFRFTQWIARSKRRIQHFLLDTDDDAYIALLALSIVLALVGLGYSVGRLSQDRTFLGLIKRKVEAPLHSSQSGVTAKKKHKWVAAASSSSSPSTKPDIMIRNTASDSDSDSDYTNFPITERDGARNRKRLKVLRGVPWFSETQEYKFRWDLLRSISLKWIFWVLTLTFLAFFCGYALEFYDAYLKLRASKLALKLRAPPTACKPATEWTASEQFFNAFSSFFHSSKHDSCAHYHYELSRSFIPNPLAVLSDMLTRTALAPLKHFGDAFGAMISSFLSHFSPFMVGFMSFGLFFFFLGIVALFFLIPSASLLRFCCCCRERKQPKRRRIASNQQLAENSRKQIGERNNNTVQVDDLSGNQAGSEQKYSEAKLIEGKTSSNSGGKQQNALMPRVYFDTTQNESYSGSNAIFASVSTTPNSRSSTPMLPNSESSVSIMDQHIPVSQWGMMEESCEKVTDSELSRENSAADFGRAVSNAPSINGSESEVNDSLHSNAASEEVASSASTSAMKKKKKNKKK
jgi:hypothetical protein